MRERGCPGLLCAGDHEVDHGPIGLVRSVFDTVPAQRRGRPGPEVVDVAQDVVEPPPLGVQ